MPKLVISLPDAGEVIHELTEAKLTIGRTEESALQIPDVSVSTQHAEMVRSGGSYVLEDVGSTNGTRVNGVDLTEPKKLEEGDRIQFGKVEAIFQASGKAAAAHPVPKTDAESVLPAASSQRPQDFGNASPFQNKRVKSNPVNMVAVALFVLAVFAFGASAVVICAIEAVKF